MNNYVLIDCGLIHKYLVKKEDIEKIEEETFYTVEVVKDLSSYTVENRDGTTILSNGSETLIFKMVENCNDKIFRYFLDEFPELFKYSVDIVVPKDKGKIKKQMKALEYAIKNDTNSNDREIHERALKKLRKALE
jgi:hypothetical protein